MLFSVGCATVGGSLEVSSAGDHLQDFITILPVYGPQTCVTHLSLRWYRAYYHRLEVTLSPPALVLSRPFFKPDQLGIAARDLPPPFGHINEAVICLVPGGKKKTRLDHNLTGGRRPSSQLEDYQVSTCVISHTRRSTSHPPDLGMLGLLKPCYFSRPCDLLHAQARCARRIPQNQLSGSCAWTPGSHVDEWQVAVFLLSLLGVSSSSHM